jgi:hypothetical protein
LPLLIANTGEETLRPIENIIQEVKEEIARLSQVLRLLEGTSTTGKRPAGTVGKNQGSKEGVVRYFQISGATALRIRI